MSMKKFLEENPLDKKELEAFMASQEEDPAESDGARDPDDYDVGEWIDTSDEEYRYGFFFDEEE